MLGDDAEIAASFWNVKAKGNVDPSHDARDELRGKVRITYLRKRVSVLISSEIAEYAVSNAIVCPDRGKERQVRGERAGDHPAFYHQTERLAGEEPAKTSSR